MKKESQIQRLSTILRLNQKMIYNDYFFNAVGFLILIAFFTVPFAYKETIISKIDSISNDPVVKSVFFPLSLSLGTFLIGNLLYLIVYRLEHPFFEKYKVSKA